MKKFNEKKNDNQSGLGLKSQQSTSDNQHQEFNIQQEDFPALPRPQSVHNKPSKIKILQKEKKIK